MTSSLFSPTRFATLKLALLDSRMPDKWKKSDERRDAKMTKFYTSESSALLSPSSWCARLSLEAERWTKRWVLRSTLRILDKLDDIYKTL